MSNLQREEYRTAFKNDCLFLMKEKFVQSIKEFLLLSQQIKLTL